MFLLLLIAFFVAMAYFGNENIKENKREALKAAKEGWVYNEAQRRWEPIYVPEKSK